MKEPPLRTTCGGGSFVLRSVREGQPSDPATTTSSDCVADEGRGCGGLWSLSLFRGFAAKPRVTLGVDGGVVVAASYPFAFSRLCRETRSTLGNALMRGRGWIADSNG